MRIPSLAAALSLAGLAACTTGGPAPVVPPPAFAAQAAWTQAAGSGAVEARWWMQFEDPLLDRLISMLGQGTPRTREALARIAEARANRDAVAGGRLPGLGASASATRNRLSENGQLPVGNIPGLSRDISLFDAGFDASWEIDLWGRRARQMEGAAARLEAAEAAGRETYLALLAETVRAYIELRAAQASLATARTIAETDARLAALTDLRAGAGEATGQEADLAQARARTSAAAMPLAEARSVAAGYRIAVLLGQPADAIADLVAAPAPIPSAPSVVAAGLPSELLKRRPDIRRAERDIAAAAADAGVATADLFPRLSLLGTVGLQSQSGGDLLSADSLRFAIGPRFSWPILAGGTMRARIRAADARQDAALARYEQSVIEALADSETGINRLDRCGMALAQALASHDAQTRAFNLAQLRFERGEDDRLMLEEQRLALLRSRQRLQDAEADKALAAVALFKALGGGWPLPDL